MRESVHTGQIIINEVKILNNRIEYQYEVSSDIAKYFELEEPFYIEYSEDISIVPKAVAVIPFMANVLPITWLTDSEIIVDELDKTFFESIGEFKQGYMDMYPNVKFLGKVNVKNIVDCSYEHRSTTAAFFSGGVDSYSTLINRLEEKPALVTLWGADVVFDDIGGWNNVRQVVEDTATYFRLKKVLIKSCFRRFIRERVLDKNFQRILNDGWWHGIQHGLGLIGHAAPYAYIVKLKTIYIPSTYTAKDKNITCASYPTIDNKVKFSSCNIVHEGFENTRQMKVHNICKFSNETKHYLNVRVCWQSKGGQNCCKCEKCYRTVMAFVAEKQEPNRFGFAVDEDLMKTIQVFVTSEYRFNKININLWKDVQAQLLTDREYWEKNEKVRWILDFNFDRANYTLPKILKRFIPKPIRKMMKRRNNI